MNKVKLDEITTIVMGQSPQKKFVSTDQTEMPLLNGPAEFTHKYPNPVQYTSHSTRLAERGDVLFCVRGSTTGRMNIADRSYSIGRGLAAIRHKSNPQLNIYIKSLIEFNLSAILGGSFGSVFPNLTKDKLINFELYIHSERDQLNIANFLRNIDSKIELNNDTCEKLKLIAKTIYDYWFVQFDFPDNSRKPYKSSGGKMVWNEDLKKKIPESWSVKKISDCLTTKLGGTPSTKNQEYWENGDIPWLSSEEISDFPILSSKKKISKAGLKNSATSLLPEGSIVVSIVRYIRTSILGIEAATNQSVVGILESDLLKKSYIYPFFISKTPKLMSLRTGAQQPHINKNVIDTTQILVPDEEVLRDYYELVDCMYEYLISNATETKKLTELRDWLLPMLMNGQVKVKEN